MSRLYYPPINKPKLASGTGPDVDPGEVARKIGKLIPSELVAGYAALVSVSLNIRFEDWRLPFFWIFFLLCWTLVPIYLNNAADPGKPKRNHIIVSTIAFPLWAYLISGSQVMPQWFDAGLATGLAVAYSLISAAVPMNR